MADALVLTGVTKRYGRFTAVDDFSLRLPTGEVLGFLGPNGAGKTTTLRMVMSIIYPDSGQIEVLGHSRASEVKDRIGYLPEERGLYRKMTVEETLNYFGRLKGLRGHTLHERINESLERIGLQDWRRKRVEALSKGMSQKLQFTSAILHRPELVILDEPFSGLDPLNVDLLERMLAELRRAGATVVFSTHQMNQAERLCDRIVLINRGRKVVDGLLTEIRERFATRVLEVDGRGALDDLARCPGVAAAQITAGHARLELADDTDPNAVLARAMQLARISRFEIQRPDLQEIFVKLVGSDGQMPVPAGRQEAVRG
ncbi:MAG TPA: ATP-binding cassette domain-containing protein [Phycisphaerae bacterium]|nr:ATP-binding cassette domain-containing protein [Phycisphaerae bacterium]